MSKSETTGAISHLPNDPFLMMRKQYREICDNSVHAAMLLSYFEGWHNHNVRAVDAKTRTTLLQRQTQEDLKEAMMGLFSKDKIIAANNILLEKGYIKICERPESEPWFNRNLSDKANWYLFCPDSVQQALDQLQIVRKKSQQEQVKEKQRKPIVEKSTMEGKTPLSESRQSKDNQCQNENPLSIYRQSPLSEYRQCHNKNNIQNKQQYNPSQESNAEQSPKSHSAAAVSFSENLNCQTDKPLANDKPMEPIDQAQPAAVGSTDVLLSSGSVKPTPNVQQSGQTVPASEPVPNAQPIEPPPATTNQTQPASQAHKSIGHVISNAQSDAIRQRVIGLAKGGRLGAVSTDDAVSAIERILLDRGQYRSAEDDFFHKLNIVCKQIRERRIDLRPQQAPPKKNEPPREQSIRQKIRMLKVERNSAEQARARGLMDEELCVTDINNLTAKINKLEAELLRLTAPATTVDTAANCVVHLADRRAVL